MNRDNMIRELTDLYKTLDDAQKKEEAQVKMKKISGKIRKILENLKEELPDG